jgi:tetratricopeptide (TPR) repeat protein
LRRNLGLALHSTGNYKDALKCFEFVLDRDPQDKAALLFSGIELSTLHEPARAVSNLSSFLEQDRHTPAAFLARGAAYLALDNFNAAAEDFSNATELDPDNSKAWEGLGKAYLLGAQSAFEAIEANSAFSPEWYALVARSYLNAQNYNMAFRYFREAESHAPDLPGVHEGLAEVYRSTGHADWASNESAKENQASNAAITEVRRRYLDALNLQQRGAQALAHLARHPDTPEYHALLGLTYRVQHRDTDSADEFRRALALSPDNQTLKLELVKSLVIANDCNAARPLLKALLQADPNSPDANQMMGECLVDENRPQDAIPLLDAALKQDPGLLPAESALGRAYLHSGHYKDAIIHLRKATALGDPAILYQLSQAYGKLGDQKASADYLKQYKTRVGQVRDASQLQTVDITPP